MIQVGDSVIARRGDREQLGLIFQVDDVSSETYPDRKVFSVRFPIDIEHHATFVWNEGEYWKLPDEYKFCTTIKKIMRNKELLWTED